jgi:putative acetyltransferase
MRFQLVILDRARSSQMAFSVEPLPAGHAGDLFALSDSYVAGLYPAESNHLVSAKELSTAPNLLLGAFTEDSPTTPIGCVGLLVVGQEPGTAEIKRLFVESTSRRLGVAHALMDHLEAEAASSGIRELRLETGIYQEESLGLYRGRGYVTIPPFGHYTPDPVSVFMAKRLG